MMVCKVQGTEMRAGWFYAEYSSVVVSMRSPRRLNDTRVIGLRPRSRRTPAFSRWLKVVLERTSIKMHQTYQNGPDSASRLKRNVGLTG
jgi:hypothetical protein